MDKFSRIYLDIIKEDIQNKFTSIESYKEIIEKAADLIKKVGMSDEEINDWMNEGLSKSLKRIQKGMNSEKWDNAVKYGWMVDCLPFVILADEFKPYFENENIEKFKDFKWYGRKFINFFTYSFNSGQTEDLEWAKEVLSHFKGLDVYMTKNIDGVDYE